MTATDVRCLHSHMGEVAAEAATGDIGEVRGKLTDMLRCSGRHGCSRAVMCSDDTMVVLRRVLHGSEQNS